MNWKRILPLIGISLCLFQLTGCQIMRLLEFKDQFQHFQSNFEFIKSADRPGLRCLKPILHPEDVLLVSHKVVPSVITSENAKLRWDYIMKKVGGTDQPIDSLLVSLTFNQNDCVEAAYYPYQFSKLFHPDFVPTIFTQLGNGKVDASTGTVSGDAGKGYPDTWIPNRDRIIAQLGTPTKEELYDGGVLLSYQYVVIQRKKKKPVKTKINIVIDNQTQKAVWFETDVFGSLVSVTLTAKK